MGIEPADDKRRKGGSTVTLIVLVAFAGVAFVCCGIGAVVLPRAIQQAREAHRREQATENLRQIGLALKNYHQQHNHPVAPTTPLSEAQIRELANRYKDKWLKEHPNEGSSKSTISDVEKTADGWHVTFESAMPPDDSEDRSRQYLHVYINPVGTLIKTESG